MRRIARSSGPEGDPLDGPSGDKATAYELARGSAHLPLQRSLSMSDSRKACTVDHGGAQGAAQ